MTPEILTAVVVAILSSKLWDFLASRFKRKDEVEDKQDRVLQAISDLKKEVGTISTKVDENAAVLARTHIKIMGYNRTSSDIIGDIYERRCFSHFCFCRVLEDN